MVSSSPGQLWLLAVVAFAAIAPARCVYRYIVYSPRRLGPLPPGANLAWRSPAILGISIAALCALAACAVFLFTPAAAESDRSGLLWPPIIGALGLWLLGATGSGVRSGRAKPLLRGFYRSYQRGSQPKRFWAATLWNAAIGGGMMIAALAGLWKASADAGKAECYNRQGSYSADQSLAACSQLLRYSAYRLYARPENVFLARGNARRRLGDSAHALADYSAALRINPQYVAAVEDRGLTHVQRGEGPQAIADFSRALRITPADPDIYFERGYAYQSVLHDSRHAIADYTAALKLKPDYAGPMAQRALCYASIGDDAHAIADFSAVIRLQPNDPRLYLYRSLAYARSGNAQWAEDDRATAVRLDPSLAPRVPAVKEPK